MTTELISKKTLTRIGGPMRLDKRARGLVLSVLLATASSLVLSSCVGREERMPSGKTARILRLYKDDGIAASIPEAYGSALIVSYCVTGADRQLSDEALGIVAFAEGRAAGMGATTIVLDRHETPALPFFGCGSAHRSAYMHDRNDGGTNEWYRVLPR